MNETFIEYHLKKKNVFTPGVKTFFNQHNLKLIE